MEEKNILKYEAPDFEEGTVLEDKLLIAGIY